MGKANRSVHVLNTVAIYLTVLEKEQHKKKDTKNMQHFLKPHFLRNMFRIPAYRCSNLACGGGSDYIKAKNKKKQAQLTANQAKA